MKEKGQEDREMRRMVRHETGARMAKQMRGESDDGKREQFSKVVETIYSAERESFESSAKDMCRRKSKNARVGEHHQIRQIRVVSLVLRIVSCSRQAETKRRPEREARHLRIRGYWMTIFHSIVYKIGRAHV